VPEGREERVQSCFVFRAVLVFAILAFFPGCGTVRQAVDPAGVVLSEQGLSLMGYSVQVGAFSRLDYAVRLAEKLDAKGLDAYYFRHADGLYRVRFGDYPSARHARTSALRLRGEKIIDEFYIVAPSDYAAARLRYHHDGALRGKLVDTAEEFLGIPYQWGGESVESGFDCSGLVMTVYKMNGLRLPRNSRAQFGAGIPVSRQDLQPGDLVFFATNGGSEVSHVGIYTGNDRFIHAPKTGRVISHDSLGNSYFEGCYLGARTYLRRKS